MPAPAVGEEGEEAPAVGEEGEEEEYNEDEAPLGGGEPMGGAELLEEGEFPDGELLDVGDGGLGRDVLTQAGKHAQRHGWAFLYYISAERKGNMLNPAWQATRVYRSHWALHQDHGLHTRR